MKARVPSRMLHSSKTVNVIPFNSKWFQWCGSLVYTTPIPKKSANTLNLIMTEYSTKTIYLMPNGWQHKLVQPYVLFCYNGYHVMSTKHTTIADVGLWTLVNVDGPFFLPVAQRTPELHLWFSALNISSIKYQFWCFPVLCVLACEYSAVYNHLVPVTLCTCGRLPATFSKWGW